MENPIDLDKLDRVIKEQGTNVTALAARIGHDRVVVSGWKNGRRIPNLLSALALAKGLGVPVEDICFPIALPGDEADPDPTGTDPEGADEEETEVVGWLGGRPIEEQAA